MIHVFRAKDGKWNYAPESVRHWPAFTLHGRFETREEAAEAARVDPAYRGQEVARPGFFGLIG